MPQKEADEEAMPLSKRQQKKQVIRDARQQRRGQKKTQKQSDALESALTAVHANLSEAVGAPAPQSSDHATLDSLLCSTFGVVDRYAQIPLAYGPLYEDGIAALESTVIRPPKYNAKFLPQEYSLLHKVWTLLESGAGGAGGGAGIVDIGAGNANCAVFAAALLGITVICVERESPREELRAELLMPAELQKLVVRVESDIEDFTSAALRKVAAAHGLQRIALMAKHPCGIGVDRSIECAAQLLADTPASGSLSLVGLVIATCCTNKLSSDDNRVSRVPEFCAFYSKRCPGLRAEPALHRAVEMMSRCAAWRNTAGSLGNAIHEDQLRWSEFFEDGVQAVRLQRLKEIFGDAVQVRFAPQECTLQDRCLVAAAPPLPAALWSHGGNLGTSTSDFVAHIQGAAAALVQSSGAIDCRPKGLRSAKFDFDYTDLNPPGD